MAYLRQEAAPFRSVTALGLIFVAGAIVLATSLWLSGAPVEALRAAVIVIVLIAISVPLFGILAARDPEPLLLFGVLIASFVLKMGAVAFRFQQRLLADAFLYHNAGLRIAEDLAQGIWPDLPRIWGSEFMRLVTGLTYWAIGPTVYGISIIFAWLGLIGMAFFLRAFTIAFPGGWRRLYMGLIFFYPSMLLWTSSLGKESLVTFFLGMAASGAAQVLRRVSVSGVVSLILGLAGVLLIRPHVAAVFAAAFGAGFLLWTTRGRGATRVLRLGGAVVFAGLAFLVIRTSTSFVNLESLSPEAVTGFITETREQTFQGGSAFRAANPATITGYPIALGTLLFRPFPWEAPRVYGLVASLESAFFLILFLVRLRSVGSAIGGARRDGYLATIVIYVLLVVFLFGSLANFGIIVRQRSSQLLPFVFMLLAYRRPAAARR